jgi:hypothetical protein
MTISTSIPSIEVTICVNGESLREYKNDDIEATLGDTGTYQASVTNANFTEVPLGKSTQLALP